MKDILLTLDTHDLDISNFDLSIVEGADSVAQNVKIRLLFFRGEWFLDTTAGLPFYTDILVKNPNLANIDSIIKAEISETPEVNEITIYSSNFIRSQRKLNVEFTLNTEYGLIPISEVLP